MPRYVDLNNPKIYKMGRDKFGNDIYHIPPDLPTADVVDKERYDRLRDNANILSDALSEYQSDDMVQVVRCKDCRWFDLTDPCGTLTPNAHRCKRVTRLWMEDDAFCAYGERREDE